MKQAALFWMMLAVVAGVTLFFIKYEVQDREETLARLQKEILQTEESIHVLNAEWSYLNQPSRLETLARKYLGLGPMKTDQLDGLKVVPVRAEDMGGDADKAPGAAMVDDRTTPPMPMRRPVIVKTGVSQ